MLGDIVRSVSIRFRVRCIPRLLRAVRCLQGTKKGSRPVLLLWVCGPWGQPICNRRANADHKADDVTHASTIGADYHWRCSSERVCVHVLL
jgi:hypothetical protein